MEHLAGDGLPSKVENLSNSIFTPCGSARLSRGEDIFLDPCSAPGSTYDSQALPGVTPEALSTARGGPKTKIYIFFYSFFPFLIMEWTKIKRRNSITASAARRLKKKKNNRKYLSLFEFSSSPLDDQTNNLFKSYSISLKFLVKLNFSWGHDLTKILFQPLSAYWIVETAVTVTPA